MKALSHLTAALSATLACNFTPSLAIGAERGTAPVTMEAAISYQSKLATDVRWLDNSRLISTVTDLPHGASSIVTWKLAGGMDKTSSAMGQAASLSPDGRWLVFFKDSRWHLKNVTSGEDRLVGATTSHDPIIRSAPRWSRDSRFVSIIDQLNQPKSPILPTEQVERTVHYIDVGSDFDQRSHRTAEQSLPRLLVVDANNLKNERYVNFREDILNFGDWSEGHVFYYVPIQGYWNGETSYTALRSFNADTGEIREVYRQSGVHQSTAPRTSPDGHSIALNIDVDSKLWSDFVSIITIDVQSGAVRRVTRDFFVEDMEWSDDGKRLFFIARAGGLDQIYSTDMFGHASQITHDNFYHSDLAISPDRGRLSYQVMNGNGRKEIRVLSLKTHRETSIAILSNPGSAFQLAEFRAVSWKSTDGLTIYGYLILPPNFDEKKKYPLFVDVHGGGASSRNWLFSLFTFKSRTPLVWHALATQGYVVFVPDMRSSGEYGPSVASARYTADDWDTGGVVKDAEDVLEGVKWVTGKSFVDTSRIAIMGHSAGGARVRYLLTQSHIFSAAILSDPIPSPGLAVQLTFISGRNTGGRLLTAMKRSTIAEKPSGYSGGPLMDGYKVTTPTLTFVGNTDLGATDPLASEVFFSMLRENGVPARMLRYPEDGHTATTDASILHQYHQVENWLERYAPARH